MTSLSVTKAVIPAAGFGTRFLPFSKSVPKEMLPVVDKPTIQYVIEEAVASGITDILMVISTGKQTIQDHFTSNYSLEERLEKSGKHDLLNDLRSIHQLANIHYTYQHELNGLGDAIARARSFVGNNAFAVLLGDTITTSPETPVTRQLIDAATQVQGPVVALEHVPREKVSRYGVVDPDYLSETLVSVRRFVEKPATDEAPSTLAVASRYVFTPDIFECLDITPRGKGNEIQITDAMAILLERRAMYGLRINGHRHDIGNKLDFVKATVEFALNRPDLAEPLKAWLKNITSC